ncbi:MAG: lipoprotein-releasing system ATP-binding protein LolD [Arcobacter sp.]|nr:MAG: lipoprotein-releasing system ATP-binding protein LolD [Arcobacter sp.]
MNNIVKIKNVNKSYDKGKTLALKDLSLSLEEGKFYTIVGKSGCGKSTLLNILGTIDEPTSGEVLYKGKKLEEYPSISNFRRDFIGFVFQFHHLIPVLTLKENIETALFSNLKYPKQLIKEKSIKLLKDFDIGNKADSLANEVSGGERQRCAIARALANNPKLLLADEPTGNVDTITTKVILDKLIEYQKKYNSTILLVTHNPLIAKISDTTIYLEDGKIISIEENR